MFPAPAPNDMLRPRRVARLLGVTGRTIINYIKSGALKAINISSSPDRAVWRIEATEYMRFIDAKRASTEAARKTAAAKKNDTEAKVAS